MSKPAFEDIFSFGSVRRNRLSYFLYSLCVFAAMIILLILVLSGFAAMNPSAFDTDAAVPAEPQGMGTLVFLFLVTIPVWISGWAVSAQRCRDFGWSGWAVLLTLVPYAGFVFAIALLFIPGKNGENRCGPDPLA